MLKELDKTNSYLAEYPKELFGSWWHVVFFDNHPVIDGIAMVYFNDKNPNGTIFISNYMLNEYPDIYATWKKTDTDEVYAERMHIRKDLRGKNLGAIALFYGFLVLKHFNKTLKYKNPLSKYGNDLWENAFDEEIDRDNETTNHITIKDQYFEQPANPDIFFYKRKIFNE